MTKNQHKIKSPDVRFAINWLLIISDCPGALRIVKLFGGRISRTLKTKSHNVVYQKHMEYITQGEHNNP